MAITEDQLTQIALETVAGKTKRQIAKELQISESTIYRLDSNAEYQSVLTRLRDELVERALSDLLTGSLEALKVLREILNDKEQRAGARVAAAKALLGNMFQVTEQYEIRKRIENLRAELSQPRTITSESKERPPVPNQETASAMSADERNQGLGEKLARLSD